MGRSPNEMSGSRLQTAQMRRLPRNDGRKAQPFQPRHAVYGRPDRPRGSGRGARALAIDLWRVALSLQVREVSGFPIQRINQPGRLQVVSGLDETIDVVAVLGPRT